MRASAEDLAARSAKASATFGGRRVEEVAMPGILAGSQGGSCLVCAVCLDLMGWEGLDTAGTPSFGGG